MSHEEHFILFSDIKELFFRSLKWIVLGVMIFGGAGFWIRSQTPVKYKVYATFKDSEKNMGEAKSVFDSLLRVIDVSIESQGGHVLLTSSPVLNPVIEKLGLQASVQHQSQFSQKLECLRQSLLAEFEKPIIEKETFQFKDVSYQEDLPKSFILFFRSKELFEIRDKEEQLLAIGEVGKPLFIEDISFTLESVPEKITLRTPYPLSFQPLQEIGLQLMENMEVSPNKKNSGFLHISFTHPRRTFGKKFVNALMESYQSYLERESQALSHAQIAYLEEKRDDYCHKMDGYLKTHVNYMKENLQEKGSFTLGQHLPLFQDRKLKFTNDLHALELKRKRLQEGDPWSMVPIGQEMATLQESLHILSKEKDELNLALSASSIHENEIAKHVKQLDTLQQEKLIEKTGINQFFSSLLSPKRERERILLNSFPDVPIEKELISLQDEKKKLEKCSLQAEGLTKEWYHQHLRLASLKEEVMKKRLISGVSSEKEYQGIDLKTARALLLETIKKRDETELRLGQMNFACQAIDQEGVEYISLIAAFPDSIGQELVREMGELKQKLQSDRNYTEKEVERYEKKLSLRKEDLARHMKQAISLTEVERERLDHRKMKIQRAIVDLLGQEIALIEKQVRDRIDEQLLYLDKEKELILDQLADIKAELRGAPDLWLKERQLQFSADLNQGMLESLVRLVESKNIENDISVLKAKPINFASSSIKARKPLLFIFGGVGGFLGAMIAFALAFMHAIYHGFPLSLKNLRLKGRVTLGKLQGKERGEVLRNVTHFIEKKGAKVISLVMGKEKEFHSLLATLLCKEGKKVLVIDLDPFQITKQKNLPGLIHYLENKAKEPNIYKREYGDYITMEGWGEFVPELLKQEKFYTLVEKLKKSYDCILIALPMCAKTATPKSLFTVSDQMVIHLEGECLEELIPYLNWESKEKSLAFL